MQIEIDLVDQRTKLRGPTAVFLARSHGSTAVVRYLANRDLLRLAGRISGLNDDQSGYMAPERVSVFLLTIWQLSCSYGGATFELTLVRKLTCEPGYGSGRRDLPRPTSLGRALKHRPKRNIQGSGSIIGAGVFGAQIERSRRFDLLSKHGAQNQGHVIRRAILGPVLDSANGQTMLASKAGLRVPQLG
ncbi:hypothetical protein [Bosea sp. 685]|uniref:hypothetical protein n=1 Tax=Bosea sp. 685 TaxID=3080057 RepID=UPI00289297F1|nr:hypothetical protein [Bosea sp. 685]WNJ89570.1 hypothetical protein RMR04_24680 [Bosea sp. 685]